MYLQHKMKQLWYTYVDWTNDGRPFYVGKGNKRRVNAFAPSSRNEIHFRIAQKHGIRRTIVFETLDFREAYEVEKLLIRVHKTFAHGGDGWWGANLDLGGPGGEMTPKSLAHREKISKFMKERTGEKNAFFGKHHSAETIEQIRKSMTGEKGPCFGRTGNKHPMFGTQHSAEARAKMSAAHAGKPLSPEHVESIKRGHAVRNAEKIERNLQIIKMFDDGMTRKAIASALGISINTVYGALHRRVKLKL